MQKRVTVEVTITGKTSSSTRTEAQQRSKLKKEEMARRLGITGGIGSGKTTVCRIFRVLGIPVFVADNVARDVMESEPDIRAAQPGCRQGSVYSGSLDRKELARIIFNRPDLLRKVNEAVHPSVLETIQPNGLRLQIPLML
jgi:dephospho-CoA kinase